MKICIVSAEVAPFAKTGGLGDVAAALARSLHARGHDVRLFLPLYGNLRQGWEEMVGVDYIRDVPLQMGPHHYRFSMQTAPLPHGGPWIYFVGCPPLYARQSVYSMEWDEPLRFAALCRAALIACQRMGFAPDVLHCNDWHTGLAPWLMKSEFGWDKLFHGTKSLMTIHNLAYQGVVPWKYVHEIGLGHVAGGLAGSEQSGGFGFLETGFLHADAISTVSLTYARQILTPQYGNGLDGRLRSLAHKLHGIPNGIDPDEWSPATDTKIAANFTADDLSGKAACKDALLREVGLPGADDGHPVIGVVSRLTKQKGFELGYRVLPKLLRERDVKLVALGSGAEDLEGFFGELARRFPRQVAFANRYDDTLAHRIEAGSDLFLMPSLFEPCGLNQMYSLAYGTVPIVHKTGGLADTVQIYDPDTGQGTGIVFDRFDETALDWALRTALDLYAQPEHWKRMQRNGMSQDFSWNRRIQEYERLYASL